MDFFFFLTRLVLVKVFLTLKSKITQEGGGHVSSKKKDMALMRKVQKLCQTLVTPTLEILNFDYEEYVCVAIS